MEFKRLKASIAHNAQEIPSIYMAICAMESLVYDIEDEADQEISSCPLGEDTLPTKLAWLCNTILDIYHDNCQEMTRNRDRLSSAIEKLCNVEEELKQLADDSNQLEQMRSKLDTRQNELNAARESKRLFDSLHTKCAEAENELQALKKFDTEKEQQRLEQINLEISSHIDEQKKLCAQLDEANATLEKEQQQAAASLETLCQKRDMVINQIAGIREQEKEEKAELLKKEQQLTVLTADQEQRRSAIATLQKNLDALTEQLSTLQDQVLDLDKQKIPAQKKRVETEAAQTAELKTQLQELEAQEKALEQEEKEIKLKRDDIAGKLETHQALYDALTADYGAKNSELQNLEKKLNDMKDKTDSQKHALYKTQLEDSIKEQQRIQDECSTMEAELQSTRAQLEEKRSRYNDLNKQKAQAAQVEVQINHYLNELEPVSSQEFQSQLKEMEERLNQLSSVRDKLHNSLVMMGEILGDVPAAGDTEILSQLKDTIQKMQSKTNQIRNDIVMCARSVKLEER